MPKESGTNCTAPSKTNHSVRPSSPRFGRTWRTTRVPEEGKEELRAACQRATYIRATCPVLHDACRARLVPRQAYLRAPGGTWRSRARSHLAWHPVRNRRLSKMSTSNKSNLYDNIEAGSDQTIPVAIRSMIRSLRKEPHLSDWSANLSKCPFYHGQLACLVRLKQETGASRISRVARSEVIWTLQTKKRIFGRLLSPAVIRPYGSQLACEIEMRRTSSTRYILQLSLIWPP